MEHSALGGTEVDEVPRSADPTEDGVVTKEVWIVSDETSPMTQTVQQGIKTDESHNLVFYDRVSGQQTLASLIGGGGSSPSILTKTSDYAIQASECNGSTYITTYGAEEEVEFTLPTAEVGLVAHIIVGENQNVIVNANTDDTLYADEVIIGYDALEIGSFNIGGITQYNSMQCTDKGAWATFIAISDSIWVGRLTASLWRIKI